MKKTQMRQQRQIPQRSFRLVCQPGQQTLVEDLLHAEGFRFEPEPFSNFCRKLLYEPFPLGASLAATFGYIYIQDRSSMLPPLALAPKPGSAVLDMAASPGSKSGFLAQLVGPGGFVLANEPNSSRCATLAANLHAANLLQAAVSSYPGQALPLFANSWEYILLDPPCSGWGTTAKNPKAIKIWQGKKIDPLIKLQRQLLTHAASLLAPGGHLLYSTCTTNADENEGQTRFAVDNLGLTSLPLTMPPGFAGAQTSHGALLIDGAASNAQGFYLSLLAKPLAQTCSPAGPKFETQALAKEIIASSVCDPQLLPVGQVAIFNEKVRFLPKAAFTLLTATFKWRGYQLGRFSGSHFVPDCRLRCLLPPLAWDKGICFGNIEEIRKMLTGTRIATTLDQPLAGIWYKQLPLGICQIKNGRLVTCMRSL